MSPLEVAWKSLARDPLRAALGILGVAAVGALLLDMLLLSRGLLVSFGEILESTGFDVRVAATEAAPGVGPPIAGAGIEVEAIRTLPEIDEVLALRFGKGRMRFANGRREPLSVYGSAAPRAGREWKLVRGDGLEIETADGPRVAVVNRKVAADLKLDVGATVKLWPRGPEAPVAFLVAGIADFPFDTVEERTVAVTLAGFRDGHFGPPADQADLLLVRSRPPADGDAAVAAIRRLRPHLVPFTSAQLVERFRRSEFSYFRQISFVLTTITSFFAFLLVTTLLTVSVNQRLGVVAALRALGFPRRRIAADLLAESALFVGLGGAAALPIGLLLARVLDDILRHMPNLPAGLHFFVLEPRAALLHGMLLFATALLAAAYPLWLATRLPIAATLRKEVIG